MGKKSKSLTEFKVGDRIFAKLKGYPWWPARIESVEQSSKPSNTKYKIMFYGTYETNVLKADAFVLFDKESLKKYGEPRKYKFFNEAMGEIQNDPDLVNLKRDQESDNETKNEETDEEENKHEEEFDENEEDEETKSDEVEKVEEDELDIEKRSSERSVNDDESQEGSEKNSKKIDKSKQKNEGSRRSLRQSGRVQNKQNDKEEQENEIQEKIIEKTKFYKKTEETEKTDDNSKREKRSKRNKSNQQKEKDIETKSIESNETTSNEDQNEEKDDFETNETIEKEFAQNRRLSIRQKKANKRYFDEEDNNYKSDEKNTSAKMRRLKSDNEDEKETIITTPKREAKKRAIRSESNSTITSNSSIFSKETNDSIESKTTETLKEETSNSSPSSNQSNYTNKQSPNQNNHQKFKEKPDIDRETPKSKIENEQKKIETPKKVVNKINQDKSPNKSGPINSLSNKNSEDLIKKKDKIKENLNKLKNSESKEKILTDDVDKCVKINSNERKSEKNKLKEKKLNEKKASKIKSIRIQFALLRMDIEIKKSLKLNLMKKDVERCCLLMQDLIKLPFTQNHLYKAPEIVETIRKCRKFKGSDKVKEMANECFDKFLFMFSVGTSESFWGLFEKERVKYLSENEDELKKERTIANKLLTYSNNTTVRKKVPSSPNISSCKNEPQKQNSNKLVNSPKIKDETLNKVTKINIVKSDPIFQKQISNLKRKEKQEEETSENANLEDVPMDISNEADEKNSNPIDLNNFEEVEMTHESKNDAESVDEKKETDNPNVHTSQNQIEDE